MAPMSHTAPKHVPAWKKIGLKLKYAKEEPEDSDSIKTTLVKGNKRKTHAEDELMTDLSPPDWPIKKSRLSKSQEQDKSEPVNRGSFTNMDTSSQALPQSAIEVTPVGKRKSVAFTPETKTEDGDSVKQLYKTWDTSQLVDDPTFDPSSASPALKVITPSTFTHPKSSTSSNVETSPSPSDSKPTPKKPKQKKRVKSKSSQILQTASAPSLHPALNNLKIYHTSLSTWKFSKHYQTYLLKHLFLFSNIPHTYDPLLLSYLQGLQGKSARSRIRKQALAVRSEDKKWLKAQPTEQEKMENETDAQCRERKKRDYKFAVRSMKKRLRAIEDAREEREWDLSGERAEWEERVRKRRRAEVVLWSVGEEDEDEEDDEEKEVKVIENVAPAPPPLQSFPPRNTSTTFAEPEYPKGRGKGMGGVEEINADGIAKASRGQKIVFGADDDDDDDDDAPVTAHATNGVTKMNGIPKMTGNAAPAHRPGKGKGMRKRRRRVTSVPDDDDSSSGGGGGQSSSEESEKERGVSGQVLVNGKGKGKGEMEESSSSDWTFGSSSGSGSASSEDSDAAE